MTTSTPHRRSIHTPGSPSDMKGSHHKAASNPDGKTPVELPSPKKSLHDQKPPSLQKQDDPSPAKKSDLAKP